MSWTYARRTPDQSHLDFFRAELCPSTPQRLIDIASHDSQELYAAWETDTGAVTALVFRTDWRRNDPQGCNFGWEVMDEMMGPMIDNCPKHILQRLSPLKDIAPIGTTNYVQALIWRERCWAKIKVCQRRPKLAIGDRVRFAEALHFKNGEVLQELTVITLRPLRFTNQGLGRYSVPRKLLNGATIIAHEQPDDGEEGKSVAAIIWEQIPRLTKMCLGSRQPITLEDGLEFFCNLSDDGQWIKLDTNGRNHKIRIQLDRGSDTYIVQRWRMVGPGAPILEADLKGVYFDMFDDVLMGLSDELPMGPSDHDSPAYQAWLASLDRAGLARRHLNRDGQLVCARCQHCFPNMPENEYQMDKRGVCRTCQAQEPMAELESTQV